MDFLPIAVLILFVLMGGGIAVFADELGRRIGKRKLTFHRRIRPKNAARILTFISGALITLITIVLISVVSSDVRIWIRDGRHAITQRDALLKEVAGLQSQRTNIEHENERLTAQNADLLGKRTELEAKLKDEQTKLAGLQVKLTASEKLIAASEGRIQGLNLRVATLNRSIESKNREKQAAEKGMREAIAARNRAQADYTRLAKEYASVSQHELEVDQKLRAKEAEVKNKDAEIVQKTKQADDASIAIQKLNSDKTELEKQIGDKQGELDNSQKELDKIKSQMDVFTKDAAYQVVQLRLRPPIFVANEELVRVAVPAGTSKTGARNKIDEGLRLAKAYAKDRGAKNDNSIDCAGMTDRPDNQGNMVTVETQKERIANQLAGLPDDQILIVYSLTNRVADEGVVVDFAIKPNPIVYQADQVLAEIRVDSRQNTEKIMGSLDELGTRIRNRALKDGMVPVGRADAALGSVSSGDIVKLLRDIEKFGPSVRVRATARHLTRAADPLVLDFEVR